MARLARAALIVVLLALAVATGADAADALTPGDLDWLRGSLNLAADSPALLTLDDAQKTRLHDLIAAKTGPDRKRQTVVQFLTGVASGSLAHTLDAARGTPPSPEIGENRPR
jgi:hypothetical protein